MNDGAWRGSSKDLTVSMETKKADVRKLQDWLLMRDIQDDTCLLSPTGWYLSRWDMVTFVALIFTALITPFEVGFL